MLQLIIDLLGQLTMATDGYEPMLHALEENILSYNEFMEMVCAAAVHEKNDLVMNQLADILDKVAFEKQTLVFIENKILNDSSLTDFLKKRKLIGQSNVNNFDQSLALFNKQCWQLITSHCEP
ncbi:unnamed protein product [Rotaria magnacalcarata]|uniref:Uncharacterized protein n=1 Tax=Rotaria magnacalcarata TaxID=392030 RepID=A0A815GQC3_9BILA|nr:unnamed protein product [Rotaria magnacalcarata]CAF1453647.1 unnamed protein product [Rotaria magnacalcarata]CAF3774260.1 unnamed protein product [Rotaria magnacalcarata]CAF3825607.1 unnamed protein product [Rotaria magnacalcarata]